MEDKFIRTRALLGGDSFEKLKNSHVAVFGLGGVGGYVVEALVRSGVEHFDLVDNDTVSVSNINRQIIALNDNIGEYKTDAFVKRIHSINENVVINSYKTFFLPENSAAFDFKRYDYVIDAIDTVTAKIELVKKCFESKTKIISSMGTGNKLDPSKLTISDIYKTEYCPLAKVMRNLCRKNKITSLKVVYSTEI